MTVVDRLVENYRSTTLDCAAALKINPSNVKAHFRSASALFALDKIYEALDVCYRGWKLDKTNQPMKALLEKIRKRAHVKQEQDKRRREEHQRARQIKQVRLDALRARKIQLVGTPRPPNMDDVEIHLSPNPLSMDSALQFPTMFLYPMHNQSDFVKAFSEQDSISVHLEYMFPAPWDTQSEYTPASVECYIDTAAGGMMKVGKKVPLIEILSNDKIVIVDGLVRVHVVPQKLAPAWIAEVKEKRAKK